MNDVPHSSALQVQHVVVALGTGAMITLGAVLLIFELPSGAFSAWMSALALAAISTGAVRYLNRAAPLARRSWIVLVALAPGAFAALCAFLAISLAIHPIGF